MLYFKVLLAGIIIACHEARAELSFFPQEALPHNYTLPDDTADDQYITDVIKTTDISGIPALLKGLQNPGSGIPGCENGTQTTATVDPNNPACFFISLCWKPGAGVRGCCGTGKIFAPPTPGNPLGTCVLPPSL
jgi:hypothetical protein